MNFYVGNQLKFGNHVYLEIEIGPKAETIEGLIRKILAALGLTDISLIENFNVFLGYDFFRSVINKASVDPTAKKAIKDSNGRKIKVPIDVYPEVIDDLKRFGIDLRIDGKSKVTFGGYNLNFANNVAGMKKAENNTVPVSQTAVEKMTTTEKIAETIRRAILLLPADVGKELMALLDPLALAIVVGVVVVWAVSHFIGVGEIIDVVLIIIGIISIGPIAWKAGEHLINFAIGAVGAKVSEDLDKAAEHLSEAIALLGVQVIMALLLKKAPKVLNEPRVRMNQGNPSTPLTMKTVGEPPVTPGKIFYEPKTNLNKHPYAGTDVGGSTNKWGDINIFYGRNATPKSIELAKFHEEFHRLLTPKLQTFTWLRQARAVLKTNSYLKSYLLRYIEEALAQTVAQVRSGNWRMIFEGIKLPLGNEGYVTVAKIGVEATGILLGPINVGGMIFRVYYSYNPEW